MAVSNELNRVKYIAEDFQTYRDEADSFFQTNYPADFNNLIQTDIGNALMDQIAFAMQSLSFMVNRRSSELFLATAKLNKSITKLARMLGYPIKPASPSSCNLTITLSQAYSFPVTIPVGFQFLASGSLIYEYQGTIDYVIAPFVTQVTIPVIEGETKSVSFISDGTENQQFSVFGLSNDEFLYSEGLSVRVDAASWDRLDLIKFEQTDTYEVLFTDAPPKLRFGDGIAGNIPATNAQIVLEYRFGKGASGAIGQNQIRSAVSALVINGQTIGMSFTNTVANIGENPEDIRHVRSFASTFFRTQNAAVIKQDYDSISALETGVALADAQIMRGIDQDITIQAHVACVSAGYGYINQAVSGILNTTVTGLGYIGVSGVSGLSVAGTAGLGVSGISNLSISGTQFLGCDVSGNVTGIGLLGVGGLSYLGVSGIGGLFVGGVSGLGVSGISSVGVSNIQSIQGQATSGITIVNDCLSGLFEYLSQTMSDTSKANNVQVIVLSSDSNNRYISPSITTLQNVQAKLRSLADAVVTVYAVDGISKIVPVDILVEIGINQNAIKNDVLQKSQDALTGATAGLLVKRVAGLGLFISDIEDAIRNANDDGDIRHIDVEIIGPSQYLDDNGNLIVAKQQIIQDGLVDVKVTKRFLIDGDVVTP